MFGGGTAWRDHMQVCLRGHVINDEVVAEPQANRARCPDDGERVISNCPNCGGTIYGKTHVPDSAFTFAGISTEAPQYCEHEECGRAFPWANKSRTKEVELSDVSNLERLFDRFAEVAKQLGQRRYADRQSFIIADEHDVQDLLHALLRMFYDDVRTEEHTPSYAGKSARMDFLLKREQIVIETKMGRSGLALGDELLVDIARYKGHAQCQALWCFVYDPGNLVANPRGIESDLSGKHGKLNVRVIIR